MEAAVQPTWVLRIGGRHEAGFLLDQPLTNRSDAESVLAAVQRRFGATQVAIDESWARLPHGHEEGQPEPTIISWNPGRRFSPSVLCQSDAPQTSEPIQSQAARLVSSTFNPLARFSLQNRVDEIERVAVEQTPLLGRVAVMGQATVLYAAPNTGKTLLTLHLLMEAVTAGRVQAGNVFYANMDDSGQGLLDKLRLVNEFGFHVGANGYAGFDRRELLTTMRQMAASKSAAGIVIVLDTLKKFVDLMDKPASRQFTMVVREFVQQGGTVIALAHTNKKKDAEGRSIYAGTSDILDDFDCGYLIERVPQDVDGTKQLVMFDNIKSRGGVAHQAAYSFARGPDLSYAELLASVEEVEPEQWRPLQEAAEILPEGKIIQAVEASIKAGVTAKMKLAAEVRKLTNASRQAAIRVIEKYAIPGSTLQRWTFTRGDRGVHQYVLLPTTA